jgi:hypothetical protein
MVSGAVFSDLDGDGFPIWRWLLNGDQFAYFGMRTGILRT